MKKRDDAFIHRVHPSSLRPHPSVSSLVLSQLCLQPCASGTPPALDRRRGNAHDLGSLFDCQSTEEAQLDDLAAQRINFSQGLKRLIQREKIAGLLAFTLGGSQ